MDDDVSTTKTVSPYSSSFYYATNVRNVADSKGAAVVATASGDPGVTISVSKSVSVSNTVSSTFGASNSIISGAVGWSITGSSTVGVQGSFLVPKKDSGKNVAKGHLDARLIYKKKAFDVYWSNTYNHTFCGTGTSGKAYGVDFTTRLTYK
jgi:hypothetical protein